MDAYAKLVAVVAVSEAAFAQAASVKFTSPLLGPVAGEPIIPGVTKLTVSFDNITLPVPGTCAAAGYNQSVVTFSDGADTLKRLEKEGYALYSSNGAGALYLCTSAKGKVTSYLVIVDMCHTADAGGTCGPLNYIAAATNISNAAAVFGVAYPIGTSVTWYGEMGVISAAAAGPGKIKITNTASQARNTH